MCVEANVFLVKRPASLQHLVQGHVHVIPPCAHPVDEVPEHQHAWRVPCTTNSSPLYRVHAFILSNTSRLLPHEDAHNCSLLWTSWLLR